MAQLRFYRQVRYDGGIRTGIGVDEQPIWHDFQAGSEDSDPAILWYVDVIVEGNKLPNDPEESRGWLLAQATPLTNALRAAAERLEIGLDDSADWPYRVRLNGLPRGVQGEIRVSAVRGLPEGELAQGLSDLADRWEAILERLSPLAPA